MIQHTHCCSCRIPHSARLLNPAVYFVKFHWGTELHKYEMICFTDLALTCRAFSVKVRWSCESLQWVCSQLDDQENRGWIPDGGRNFSFRHSAQTLSGSHSASYPGGILAHSPGVMRPGVSWPPPSNAEVENAEAITQPSYGSSS